MTDISFRSYTTVTVNMQAGSDLDIAESAWVSTGQDGRDRSEKAVAGLIGYLMEHRHGTPFEEGYLSITAEVPIFVAREWMRHRIGSYSEISARYTELKPAFWVPDVWRGIKNVGTSARPGLEADEGLREEASDSMKIAYRVAWDEYAGLLEDGIANEVARAVLPVGTYTRFRARFNPRSLMHFLSLRIDHADNTYPTYPQAEIQDAAEQLEDIFAEYWPITHKVWHANGRVAP